MQLIDRAPLRGHRLIVAALPLAAALAVLGGPPGVAPAALEAGEAQARGCPGKKANPGTIGEARVGRVVSCLINLRRSHRGLPQLNQRAALRDVARRHSRRMVNRGCFSHVCPGEKPLVRRIRQQTNYLPCKCRSRVTQMIGGGANARGRAIRTVRNWIRTRRNRRIIFSRRLQHIGVGVVWGGPGAPANDNYGTYSAVFGFKR